MADFENGLAVYNLDHNRYQHVDGTSKSGTRSPQWLGLRFDLGTKF